MSYVSFNLGLRRGEAVGLSWGDIDFRERTVSVKHAYDDDALNASKTQVDIKVLPMPDNVYRALSSRMLYQMRACKNNAP